MARAPHAAPRRLVAYGFVAEQPIALDSANFVASLDCLTRVGQWQPAPPADAGEARQVPLQPAAAAPHWAGWAPELQRPQAPGAAQPHEQQLGWQAPAAAPAETARHNEAARHQQRRDSLDSFVLPQSALQQRQRMAEQEAAGQPQLQHSPAPRPRNLFDASPARPAAPGSATRGRPAQASSSQQLMAEGLMSPARLPSLNVMSAQKLGRRAPEGALPPRPPPAAAAGLQSPMRLPLTSDVKRQLQQSPAPAAQQQQRQQEQPRAGSETPQRSPRPAQALARGLPALPAEASAAVQQLLADLPVDSAPGSPSGGVDGGSPRLQYRMAAPGDVLLYCEKMTERSTGLPLLRRLLVTAVTPLSDGSPKKARWAAPLLFCCVFSVLPPWPCQPWPCHPALANAPPAAARRCTPLPRCPAAAATRRRCCTWHGGRNSTSWS